MALDNFSSDCFLSEDLMKQLGIEGGSETDLFLTTFEGRDVKRPTYAVHNLEVLDLDGGNVTEIPTTYSHSNWPFDLADCPNQSDCFNLNYIVYIGTLQDVKVY